MKYVPKHSNFTEMQYEIADELLSTRNKIEDIKDAVAKYLDDYVEAILKEHVEEVKVWTIPGSSEDCTINVIFSAGQKVLPSGQVDMFERQVPLTEILDDFNWWDELSDYEPGVIRKTATRIAVFAARLMQRADEIQKENEDYDRKWEEMQKGGTEI